MSALSCFMFQGKGVVYSSGLPPRKMYDVNTFGGHKWVFVKSGTDERLVADGRTVWIGEPWQNTVDPAHPTRARRKLVQLTKPGEVVALIIFCDYIKCVSMF